MNSNTQAQFKEHREKYFRKVQSVPVILNRSSWQLEFFYDGKCKKNYQFGHRGLYISYLSQFFIVLDPFASI